MRLTVVGCAGSFPGPDSPASCYLVEAEETGPNGDRRTWRVVLDLGNGALGALQRYIDPLDLDAILLTHLHPDHCLDVCSLHVLHRYHPERGAEYTDAGPLHLYGPPDTERRLSLAYEADAAKQEDADGEWASGFRAGFHFHTLQEGHDVRVGPLRITPVPMCHPVPTFGLRVAGPAEDGTGEVTIAYTGDTDVCENLDTLAVGADVLLAEASFAHGRAEAPGLHLTGRQAGQVAG
ncbi:MAG: MBL fold metallo-hydrolase, partial [Micrococcales bacterium]